MGELWLMFRKELMDILRDRRLVTAVILPLILLPAMFGVLQSSSHSSRLVVSIINEDSGKYSKALVAFLERNGIVIDENSSVTLIIPAGFSEAIESGRSPHLLIRTRLPSVFDFKTVKLAGTLKALVLRFGEGVLPSIRPEFRLYVGNDVLSIEPSRYVSALLRGALAVPFVLFAIGIYAAQAIAASVAMEKEGKTLETLLTLPVSRRSIILGKILASVVFSLLVLASLSASFCLTSLFSKHSSGYSTGVSVGTVPLIFLSAGTFLLFVLMLLTSLLVSLFTLDVRSALSVAGLVEVLYLIPLFVIFMGLDVSGVAALLVKADPGYAPILAFLSATSGNYITALGALFYLILWNAVVLRLAVWVFESGTLMTKSIDAGKLRWLVRVKI
ncbi:ABC transporter permease [Thermococcus prieurii]